MQLKKPMPAIRIQDEIFYKKSNPCGIDPQQFDSDLTTQLSFELSYMFLFGGDCICSDSSNDSHVQSKDGLSLPPIYRGLTPH